MIHFFGDSFTYGQGCTPEDEYYKKTYNGTQKTWVELISEYQKDDYTNYGMPGCGNQKIIDSVLENIKNIKSGDIVFLSRTHDERIQIPFKEHFMDILPSLVYEYDDVDRKYYETINDYIKFILFPNMNAVINRYDLLFSRIVEYFNTINVDCIRWNVEHHTIYEGKTVDPIIRDGYPGVKD